MFNKHPNAVCDDHDVSSNNATKAQQNFTTENINRSELILAAPTETAHFRTEINEIVNVVSSPISTDLDHDKYKLCDDIASSRLPYIRDTGISKMVSRISSIISTTISSDLVSKMDSFPDTFPEYQANLTSSNMQILSQSVATPANADDTGTVQVTVGIVIL